MRIRSLLFLFPLLGACTVESSDGGSPDTERGNLGKADLVGSCEHPVKDLCGGKGKGNCWCDEACVDFGDCCSDAGEVCGIEPEPPEGTACGGWLGDTCADDEFCAYEPGQTCGFADASAVCVTKPEVCIKILAPVCGCDGETYSNSCFAGAAGTGIMHEGECEGPTECGGFLGLPCEPGQMCIDNPEDDCDPENGGADCGGICVDAPAPEFCGGFANFPCPDGLSCIDDPNDDCDPQNGGADCGGICVEEKPECGDVQCALFCENGFVTGKDGCEICECAPDPEPEPACHVAGCSGELCVGPEGPDFSICIAQPWTTCLSLTKCGEFGDDGSCGWDPNPEYLDCLASFGM